MKKLLALLFVFIFTVSIAYADNWGVVVLNAQVEPVTFNFLVNGATGEGTVDNPDCQLAFSGLTPMNQAGKKLADAPVSLYWNVNTLAYDVTATNPSANGLADWEQNEASLPLNFVIKDVTENVSVDDEGFQEFAGESIIIAEGLDAVSGVKKYVYFMSDFTSAKPGVGYGAALTFQLETQ